MSRWEHRYLGQERFPDALSAIEVEHFFTVYKDLEGARVEPLGWENAVTAKERIRFAINHYWDMRAGRLPKHI